MNATEVAHQFVKGLEYPIAKSDIVRAARETSVGPTVLGAIERIDDRDYSDADDLAKALTAAS
ncbi:MAG TPA: DUF2795 domain-containing protein [Candidatus Limnocylindria bacterium]